MGSHFERILLRLNETNSSGPCLKTLMDINKEVEWPDNKPNIAILQRSGYMKSLMNNLYSSRKDIIHVSLSIFLNCTMDKDFTRDAMEQDLGISLYDLFNLHPEEESMKQIIFKMLGNICKHHGAWIFDKTPDFQTLTLNLLKRFCSAENVCEDTLVTALRFWRLLLYDTLEFSILLVTDPQTLTVMSFFFIEVMLKTKINESVLQETFKLLYEYSEWKFEQDITSPLPGESIFYLGSRMRFFLERIPRIMSKFVKIDQLKARPQHADICNWIIGKIKDLDIEDSKDEFVGYTSCLCFMLLECDYEQHKEIVPELIKVLNFIENPSYADIECFILIIMTFSRKCTSTVSLAQYLVNCNIVDTLIEKLMWVSGNKTLTFDFDHQMTETRFLKISERPYVLGSCRHPNPTFNEENLAPSSNNNSKVDTESGLGCPCSDRDVTDIMKSLLHKEIMNLFHRYIFVDYGTPELASEDFMTALCNSAVHFENACLYSYTTPVGIKHLFHLMGTSVIEKIYYMNQPQPQHNNSSCAKCTNIRDFSHRTLMILGKLAMSKEGMKNITQGLMTDTGERKAGLILTIPYLFCERLRLAHLLLQFDCLNTLAQLLKDGSSLKERIIKFFHVLASRRLAIADPTQVDVAEHSQPAILAPPNSDAANQKLVTFKLDDGSTVQADRNLLTKRSRYFSALLEGHFKESGEDEVALRNTPIDSLMFMLHLLEDPENVHRLVMERDLDFLFDAIVLIDRHGQSDLCGLITSCIKTCRMNSETVAAIYRSSIQLDLNLLRMDAVTFALVHNFEDNERVVMFDSLLGCTEELTGDIQTILERYLTLEHPAYGK